MTVSISGKLGQPFWSLLALLYALKTLPGYLWSEFRNNELFEAWRELPEVHREYEGLDFIMWMCVTGFVVVFSLMAISVLSHHGYIN